MSDMSNINLEIRKKDLDKFKAVLGNRWYHNEMQDVWPAYKKPVISIIIYEANYGWCGELEEFAKAGLTFKGKQGMGGDYLPQVFSCSVGDYTEIISDDEGSILAYVNKEGIANESSINKIKRYYEILKKVEAYFNENNNM